MPTPHGPVIKRFVNASGSLSAESAEELGVEGDVGDAVRDALGTRLGGEAVTVRLDSTPGAIGRLARRAAPAAISSESPPASFPTASATGPAGSGASNSAGAPARAQPSMLTERTYARELRPATASAASIRAIPTTSNEPLAPSTSVALMISAPRSINAVCRGRSRTT